MTRIYSANNRVKRSIPTNVRVRMHRQRKKLKDERQKLINTYFLEISRQSVQVDEVNECAFTEQKSSLRFDLRCWANSHRISKRAIDDLLHILGSHGINSLPQNH